MTKKVLAFMMCGVLFAGMLTGCSTDESEDSQNSTTKAEAGIENADEDMFTDRDYDGTYSASESVSIQLEGNTATASSDSVSISGGNVTITEEATYVISGELTDGSIIIEAEDSAKIQIVLNGATIHSESSAALYIVEADKVFVTLADGSENTLSNGGTFTAIDDNNIDAAVFSKQDLTVNGSGTLTVTSPAGHGIVCKDDFVCTSGTLVITSASHGIDANDSVRITKTANFSIDAGKDGVHCENTEDTELGFVYISGGKLDIEAEGDGIAASGYMQMESVEITILAGGGSDNASVSSSSSYGGFMGGQRPGQQPGQQPGQSSTTTTTDDSDTSMKGLKSAGKMLIASGTYTIDSADDTIHSNDSVTIGGGTFLLVSGDDAVHAEDTLTITDCDMNISNSYEGLEAQYIYVHGGDMVITSSDDGLNASGGNDASGMTGGRDAMFGGGGMNSASTGSIEVTGGKITVYASGDGFDSNGTLTISGGNIYVANPTSGDTSVIDSDSSPVITGGTFISTGSTTMMAQTFADSSTQGVIACTVGNQSAGSTVTVTDTSGNVVIEYDVEYSCVLVIISSPDIVKGDTYTLSIGATSGTITAD